MAHNQAKRRKQAKVRQWRAPAIPFARLARLAAISVMLFLSFHFGEALLDQPIQSIIIDGPFQRVSALQIEEAIGDELEAGFLSVNLPEIQERIVSLPWIDRASVGRRWPGKLQISVNEQVPAACWGERGLLNIRGELFVKEARHIPAELPRLSGPDGHSAEVAKMYLNIRERLILHGLDLRSVNLDSRGAWRLTLLDGIAIRLGRRNVDARADLFLGVVAIIVSNREADIEFIDMRYNNGFTIGWKPNTSPLKPAENESSQQQMVADRSKGPVAQKVDPGFPE